MKKIEERKLRKIGNSIVLTVPKDFLEEHYLEAGDTVIIDNEILGTAIRKKEQIVDDEFLSIVEEVSAEYDTALRNLVER